MNVTIPPTSRGSTLALGNFPTEIAFEILDKLFMEGPELTHTALCSLRSLSLVDRASAIVVHSYLQLRPPSQRLEKALRWEYSSYAEARSRLHREGPDLLSQLPGTPMAHPDNRSPDEDIMTSVILDDCAGCFDWLCVENSQFSRHSVNPHGWSYVGLAMYAGSVHALKHFLNSAADPADFVFTMLQYLPSCAYRHGPGHFDLMTEKRALESFAAVVDILEPFFLQSSSQLSCANLRSSSRLNVCSFVTPELAERLQANFAMSLNDPSIWHAAVQNGPVFLEYVLRRGDSDARALSRLHDGRNPLRVTTERNRVDSARWLVENYTSFDITDQKCFEIDLVDEIRSATVSRTSTSVQFLEVFLSVAPSHYQIEDLPLFLISRLVFSLYQEFRHLEALGHGREALLSVRESEERLAIQKCRVIFQAGLALGSPCIYHGSDPTDPSRRDYNLESMTEFLEELGSEQLSQAIESSCSCGLPSVYA